jgi:UDP:flavonoid glycosyltransferase YjiC (YdhE family)
MSRFVFASVGSLGDVHPYIAVARALIRRGHQAVLATSEEYRAAVEGAGVEFAAVPPSMAELGDYRALVGQVLEVRRGAEFLVRKLVMPYLRPAYDRLSLVSEGADLLVSHPLSVTLPLVAQQRGLPWVATVLAPMSMMSSHDPPTIPAAPWFRSLRTLGVAPYRLVFGLAKRQAWSWEKPLRQFRRELGLPPQRDLALFEGQFSPWLNLALFDEPLASRQPDWPANTRVCGSPLFDGGHVDPAIGSDLEHFLAQGEPPIVFALGSSAVWIAGDFWEHAVTAAVRLKRRAILITGPDVPKSLPDGVRAYAYLPYSLVFPRAAVVVHQAGIGTLAQALRSGRPQLMLPVAFDQPDNARRAQALGVGRSLPFGKVTAERMMRILGEISGHPEYAVRASSLAQDLNSADAAALAALELIGCLVKSAGPQTPLGAASGG